MGLTKISRRIAVLDGESEIGLLSSPTPRMVRFGYQGELVDGIMLDPVIGGLQGKTEAVPGSTPRQSVLKGDKEYDFQLGLESGETAYKSKDGKMVFRDSAGREINEKQFKEQFNRQFASTNASKYLTHELNNRKEDLEKKIKERKQSEGQTYEFWRGMVTGDRTDLKLRAEQMLQLKAMEKEEQRSEE